MSTTDETADPLVAALQRKTNHQTERIENLEEQIEVLETKLEMVQHQLAEVEE